MAEAFTESREKLQVKFSEIVIPQGIEVDSIALCRLVTPIPAKDLNNSASDGSLTFFEVYVAKIFEITIYYRGELLGNFGELTWSIFAGDSQGSEDGQKLVGLNYRKTPGKFSISSALALEKAKEYGLGKAESTLVNKFGVGSTQVDIPMLDISGEKIGRWKKFVKLFLQSFVFDVKNDKLAEVSLKPDQQSSTYKGEGITVIITGFAGDASYTNIDSINRCLHIPLAANYSLGRYIWEDGEYTHVINPDGEEGDYTLTVTRTFDGREIYKASLKPSQQSSTYKGEGITVIITGFAGDASYTNIDSINRCLHIPLAANYSSGRYVWEDGEYTHVIAPDGEGYLLSIYSNPQTAQEQLKQPTFEGSSEKGDFQEALANAIQKAKQLLRTEFVAWDLDEVNGYSGGFSDTNILKLSITITATSPSLEP
jgi:hypothetical protein